MNPFSAEAIDWANYLSRYDLICKAPSRCWQDGIALGNGELNALAYESEGFYPEWTVNHSRLWDERLPEFHRFGMDHIRRIASGELSFAEEMQKENPSAPDAFHIPTPKYGGQLRLCFGIAPQFSPGHRITKRLHLHEAALETSLDKHLSHPRIRSFICTERNLLVISVRHVSLLTAFRNRAELFRIPEPGFEKPVFHISGDFMGLEQHLPTLKYMVAAKIVPRGGGEYRELFEKITHPSHYEWGAPSASVSPSEGNGCVSAEVMGDFDILLTIVTDKDAPDLFAFASERLAEAAEQGSEKLYEEHCVRWAAFWRKNYVALNDPFLEQLWYLSNYHLRCGLGGYPAAGLCGPWFGRTPTAAQFLPWNGNYTNDYNSQLPLMVPGRINRPELADNSFRMLADQLPEARKNAILCGQSRGALFPLCCGPGGEEISSGRYRFCQGSGPYWCVVLHQHYLYTRDETFFKTIFYPILREVAIFFTGYLQWEEKEQLYHLRISQNPELMYFHLSDPVDTLAFLKYTLKAAVESAGRLKANEELSAKWKYILSHYPAYPSYENGFLPLRGLRPDHIHHSRTLGSVFPAGEFDPLSPETPQFETAKKELYSAPWDFFMKTYACREGSLEGWTGKVYHRALPACRLGDRKLAWKYLEDLITTNVKPNGLISHNIAVLANSADSERNLLSIPEKAIHHDHGPEPISLGEVTSGRCWEEATEDLECKEKMFPVLEGPALFLLLISEMLLQSYNGILRLFPAWPEECDAEFRDLRAEGSLLVSASKKDGAIHYVRLYALADVNVRLLNPWPERTSIHQHGKGEIPLSAFLEFSLHAGEERIFSTEPDTVPVPPEISGHAEARFIVFANGTGAFLGKPELSEYYAGLEKLRG